MIARLLLALTTLLAVTPAWAQGDPRLRTIAYAPDSVTVVKVAPGFVATIVLSPGDRIQSVAVGNSSAWEVVPNKNGDHLFVKPLAPGVTTNAEVVTDARHYSFLLQPAFDGDPAATLQLTFTYPAERRGLAGPGGSMGPNAAVTPPPADASSATAAVLPGRYRLSGDHAVRPLAIDDDGVRTHFLFDTSLPLPAVYAIDAQHRETLVTLRRDALGWVVDRVWPRYVMRLGHDKATARRIAPDRR